MGQSSITEGRRKHTRRFFLLLRAGGNHVREGEFTLETFS